MVSTSSHRAFLPSALLLAVVALAGCEIFISRAECPDLNELCPELACDNYQQDRDGCSLCACEVPDEPEEPIACFSDGECPDGLTCDTVNFCERDPACLDGQDCPAVCYGRCVEQVSTCASDADCDDGEICVPVENRPTPAPEQQPEPEPGDGGGDAAPPPVECFSDSECDEGTRCQNGSCARVEPSDIGVCLPATCSDRGDVALPACPPGTEVSIDFSSDPCGTPTCVPVDGCRALDAETCANTPGCEVFLEDCCGGTEPNGCDCAPLERCAATDDCEGLDASACLQNPACELVEGGPSSGGGGDGGAPICEVCDSDGVCRPCGEEVDPPPASSVCIARPVDATCLGDAECGVGERCELITVCATGCTTDPTTNETTCIDECWFEPGTCVPATSTCWDIVDPELCLSTPGCELVDPNGTGGAVPCDVNDPDCAGLVAPVCQPASAGCTNDSECPNGQHCAVRETCAPCDPSSADDIGCLAPCFLEGQCVDGTPPSTCDTDADCGAGGSCVPVDVCNACPAPPDGFEAPPCDVVCTVENRCVIETQACFVDADCGTNELCDFSQGCAANPTGLIACQGVCVAVDEPPPPDGAYCLSASDCGANEFCVTNDAVCRDNPASDVEACWGWCAGGCTEAETPAIDFASGQCVVFPDGCIPPGWEPVSSCAP